MAPVGSKSGTTIVKSAPPKETARITVKPSLPAVKPVGNLPVKPAVAAAAGAAVGAAAAAIAKPAAAKPVAKAADAPKPATTIVKTPAAAKVTPATVKPGPGAPPVPAMPAQYQDEASTTLTTALAGVLAGTTWITAALLAASYWSVI